jgi:hypothetical protein
MKNKLHILSMMLFMLLLLGGCSTWREIAIRHNKRAASCISQTIDLMEVCIYEWATYGCVGMIKDAGKACMKTGEMLIQKKDLTKYCEETTINCAPPGEPG